MSDDGQQWAKISTGNMQSVLTFEQKEGEEREVVGVGVGGEVGQEESAYFWQATCLIPRKYFFKVSF